jgi:hypothetical protein
MADRKFGRRIGTGFGPGSKRTQFVKGKSGNPKGRRQKSREQTIDLYPVVTKKVTITRDGKKYRTPFAVAHVERLMEKAAKGDSKADHTLLLIYKALGILGRASARSDEPYEFTLNLGKPKKDLISLDDDESDSSPDDKSRDFNEPADSEE